MADIGQVVSRVRAVATSSMTDKHIFALLAYEDRPGVREQFDRQFGAGAAARVLDDVNRPAPVAETTTQPQPVCVELKMDPIQPTPVVVNVPEMKAPQVVVQRVDDERIAALERQIAELKRPRKIRVTGRDVNGNITELEQINP